MARLKDYTEQQIESLSLSKAQKYYVEVAVREAKNCTMNHKHGCVIVKGGTIIASAHNHNYDWRYENSYKLRSRHAEAAAILQCKSRGISLKGAALYVIRITGKKESLALSKPCEHCAEFIEEHCISQVYHS